MRTSQTIPESAEFAESGTLSSVVNLDDRAMTGILMPAEWTAGPLTVQLTRDGTTFYDYYDKDGNEYTIDAVAGKWHAISPSDFPAVQRMRLRSGTAATPVPQDAARTVVILSRHV